MGPTVMVGVPDLMFVSDAERLRGDASTDLCGVPNLWLVSCAERESSSRMETIAVDLT
jgi:hypothetical protein